ncbi:putative DNA-binding protein (MmcQ/YjbR family) [Bradyrhizobium sp. GM7.3]
MDDFILALAAPLAVAAAKTIAELVISWMKKHGSRIEIRVGDRVIATINSAGDAQVLSKRIQEELAKDKQQQSANRPSTTSMP